MKYLCIKTACKKCIFSNYNELPDFIKNLYIIDVCKYILNN